MILFDPFTVEEVSLGYTLLKAKTIQSFVPSLSKDRKFFVVEFDPWAIVAFSESIADLKDEVARQIAMGWDFLVKEDDSNLTVNAKKVKDRLLEDFLAESTY